MSAQDRHRMGPVPGSVLLLGLLMAACSSESGIVKDVGLEASVDAVSDLGLAELPAPDQVSDLGVPEVVKKDVPVPDQGCEGCSLDAGEELLATDGGGPLCGNGLCEPGEPAEDALLCPEDCGPCGDGVCGLLEAAPEHWCAKDCAPACGDGECEQGEVGTPGGEGSYGPPDCGGCYDGCCGYQDLFNPDLAECKGADCAVTCGDGKCTGSESWEKCPVDCGWCGDGLCGEVWGVQEPCPVDCVKPCGDGLCNGTEDEVSCAVDCGPCGDGVCGLKEMVSGSCPEDCPPECGDGECGETEEEVCPGDCACLPKCGDNWECGDDAAGCGQLCGVCPVGSLCQGHMCCVPDCLGKQCGDDGCGGTCGSCTEPALCEAGECVCQEGCQGKECGVDACGNSCGECDDGADCTQDACADGLCVSTVSEYFCLVDGQCWIEGTVHPENPCLECKPAFEQGGWSERVDNTPCGPGLFCQAGECTGQCIPDCDGLECGGDGCGGSCGDCDDGLECTYDYCDVIACVYKPQSFLCVIDGQCWFWGAPKPGEPCMKCDPNQSQHDWSPETGPVTCEAGKICYQGACCDKSSHCAGKQCGDDGCGSTCGECQPGALCLAGQCKLCDDGNTVDWDGCKDGDLVEFLVNEFTADDQHSPAVAAFNNGDFTVVWASQGQQESASYSNIVGRRYSADGIAGPGEYTVNTTQNLTQSQPDVAALADDGHVVVWSGHTDLVGWGESNIIGRLFAPDGVAAGDEFVIQPNTGSGGPATPSVTALANGGFVVAWRSQLGATDYDLEARVFNSAGEPAGAVISVNTTKPLVQQSPAVSAFPDSRFVVAWASEIQSGDGVDFDVLARVFDASGVGLSGEIVVNQSLLGDQLLPAVTALPNATFVVAWQDEMPVAQGTAVLARRFQSGGAPIAGEVLIGVPFPDGVDNTRAAVAGRSDSSWKLAWTREDQGVAVAEFDKGSNQTQTEIAGNDAPWSEGEYRKDLALFHHGEGVLVWEADGLDGDGLGIFARRVKVDGTTCGAGQCIIQEYNPACPGGCDDSNSCTTDTCQPDGQCQHDLLDGTPCDDSDPCTQPGVCDNGQCTQQTPIVCDDGNECTSDECQPGKGCAFSNDDFKPCDDGNLCTEQDFCAGGMCLAETPKDKCLSTDACKTPLNSVCYPDVGCQFVNATGGACNDGIACTTDDTCVNGACTGLTDACDDCDSCTVDSCGTGECTNSVKSDGADCDWDGTCQAGVCVAGDQDCDDDNSVDWDGCNDGAISEFQLDPGKSVPGDPGRPAFAALPTGGYVVAWETDEASLDRGIVFQLYGEDGTPTSQIVHANATTQGDQASPRVCALPGGGVVVWEGQGAGDPDGVYMSIFGADGSLSAHELRVNTEPEWAVNPQTGPAVAVAGQGGFGVVWSSYGQDGDSYGVIARLYDGNGAELTGEVVVNDVAAGVQLRPAVVSDGSGGLVIAWRDKLPTADAGRIKVRTLDASGQPGTTAHVASLFAAQEHDAPDLVRLPGGKFAVFWERSLGFSSPRIYGRFLLDSGAPVGNEFGVVCDQAASDSIEPVAAVLDNGTVVVVWQGGRGGEPRQALAQLLDSDGNRMGQPIVLPSPTVWDRFKPGVAALPGTGFVAGWTGSATGDFLAAWAQRFALNGKKIYH